MSNLKWCCPGVRALHQMAGERTFSILVNSDLSGRAVFTLQHRALNPGAELPSSDGVAVSLVSDLRLQYCPWCGKKLESFYKKQIDALAAPVVKKAGDLW